MSTLGLSGNSLPYGDAGPDGGTAPSVEEAGARAEPDGPRLLSPREKELDDAVYYLRHDCGPCAERHFHRARLRGATADEIAAARALGGRSVSW